MTTDRFHCQKPCRVLIFSSPKAGSGKRREQVPRLIRLLSENEIESLLVQSVAQLKEELLKEEFDHVVVAAGGDGTISLAASIATSEVPIVPMPLGTENLLAKEFGHSAEAEAVIMTIRHGSSFQMDAGVANLRPFLIMATCGFDAEVVRGMHLTRRGHIRRWSYFRPIVRALLKYRFPKLTVRVDDQEPHECGWAMVFNLPRYAAGLKIEPDAVGDDGQLDVILFDGKTVFHGLKYLVGIWLGSHLNSRDVTRLRGRKVEIVSDARVPYEMDGDYAGRLPLSINTLAGRVHLLLPPVPTDGLPQTA
ncbi:MAG: diacylglycerol kinase family protein [Rubripirellula sp.]